MQIGIIIVMTTATTTPTTATTTTETATMDGRRKDVRQQISNTNRPREDNNNRAYKATT